MPASSLQTELLDREAATSEVKPAVMDEEADDSKRAGEDESNQPHEAGNFLLQ